MNMFHYLVLKIIFNIGNVYCSMRCSWFPWIFLCNVKIIISGKRWIKNTCGNWWSIISWVRDSIKPRQQYKEGFGVHGSAFLRDVFLTWSMMGEMAAELTGLSVLKVLMWSRDDESNSWVESNREDFDHSGTRGGMVHKIHGLVHTKAKKIIIKN